MPKKITTIEQIAAKAPPNDLDAEKAVLGSVLLDPARIDDLAELLSARDFYGHVNQILYGHILGMAEDGGRVDVALLADRLKRHGDYEGVGHGVYLAEVMQSVPTAANAVYYAQIVHRLARQRRCILAGVDFTAAVQNARDVSELDAALDRHEAALSSLDVDQPVAELVTASPTSVAARLVERSNSPECKAGGILTGLPSLDAIIGGVAPKRLITVAARPGCGKTSLGEHLALAAAEQGACTLFVSLEMSAEELHIRAIANRAQVNSFRAQQGFLTEPEQNRVVDAGAELERMPIVIDDRPVQTLEQIARKARRLQRHKQLELIVIDYLQLIEPSDSRHPRAEQVARTSRGLKRLAKQLAIPIVALAQLNRSADNSRPRLSHLRESGAIEQDSDVVIFLHSEDPSSDRLQIIVEKNRSGPVGEIEVTWNRGTNTFRERTSAWS